MNDADSAPTSGDEPWVDPWSEQQAHGRRDVGLVRASVYILGVVVLIGFGAAGLASMGSPFPQECAGNPQVAPPFMPPVPYDDLGKHGEPEPMWELPGGPTCPPVEVQPLFPQESAGNPQVAPETIDG